MVLLVIIFSLTACGNADKEITELSVEDLLELRTWQFTSGVPNNLIAFKSPKDGMTFDCTTDKGNFYQKGKAVTAKPGDSVSWQPEDGAERAYVDIVLKNGDDILGYSVIEISKNAGDGSYSANIAIFSLFLTASGEPQKITESEVAALIEAAKK